MRFGPTCKPRSVQRFGRFTGDPSSRLPRLCDHLSWPDVTAWLVQPTRGLTGGHPSPCLALHRVGVAWPSALLPAPVVSYTTFSPWPVPTCGRAVVFCGPVRRLPCPGVTRHPAHWSADFPQAAIAARGRPVDPASLSSYRLSTLPSNTGWFSMRPPPALQAACFPQSFRTSSGVNRPLTLD